MSAPGPIPPLSDSAAPASRPRRSRALHSGDLWLLLFAAAVLAAFLFRLHEPLLDLIYSPTAFVILVLLLLQFLILKARDRSRFYRLQLQMITARRREDVRQLRETHETLATHLSEIEGIQGQLDSASPRDVEIAGRLNALARDLERARDDIAGR